MPNSVPEGYYRDSDGDLQPDRRNSSSERRGHKGNYDGDRRNISRRKSDIEFLKREHEKAIEDALGEFAEEHNQR